MTIDLLEIFNYGFMNRAMIAGLVVGLIAPMIGLFLVIRRYSLLVDTLAHISLIGVAGGLFLSISPILGAILASVGAGIGMEKLRENKQIFSDSILAIFLSGSLAFSLILFSLVGGSSVNLFSFLFGSITTVNSNELLSIILLSIVVVVFLIVLHKKLFLISYAEEFAKVNGINTKAYNYLLITLAGITIALSIKVVGALLIGALMVIPVVSAIQFGYGFTKSMIISIVISLISVFLGIYSSFYLSLPASAMIVMFLLLFFGLSLILRRN